jgi:hypothetical protein
MNLCDIRNNYIILLRRVFYAEEGIRMVVKDARIYLTRLTEQDARSLHITIVDVTTAYNDLTRTRSDYVTCETNMGR